LVTALSRARIAWSTAVRASSPGVAAAVRAVFTTDRTRDRTARFRWRRFSLVRIRLIADFVLAT
jgi:hypothetical protein